MKDGRIKRKLEKKIDKTKKTKYEKKDILHINMKLFYCDADIFSLFVLKFQKYLTFSELLDTQISLDRK